MPTVAGYRITKKIFETSTTAVFHASNEELGRPVVVKIVKGEHPDNELLNRLKHEYSLLCSLDSSYVIKPLTTEKYNNSLALILEDCQQDYDLLAPTLAARQFSLEEIIVLGIEFARALEVIHTHGLVLLDLTPEKVLVGKNELTVKLLDLSATAKNEQCADAGLPGGMMEEALPYISPELTGRLEAPVDHRSDFYSLGVILFELTTGSAPFMAEAPDELIHSHLAQFPPPPYQLNQAIPPALSSIISKLLEKSPAKRYQHSHGIISDLQRCLKELQQTGEISVFVPGENDIRTELIFPSLPVGREQELELLGSCLAKAAAGGPVACLVRSQSGAGKSSLVRSFISDIAVDRAYVLQGHFEPAALVTPCGAISHAVQQITHLLLSEDDSAVARWKDIFNTTLQGEGQVLVDMAPDLERIIGGQEELPHLPSAETEKRLIRVLGRFFRAIGEHGSALVLVFDNLHWADQYSFRIIEEILEPVGRPRILFIGLFREIHVPDHPLTPFLHRLKEHLPHVEELRLTVLAKEDVTKLLRKTLGPEKGEFSDLSEICFEKTGGNPFYLKQFILSLFHTGHLFYSTATNQWRWNEEAIRAARLTKNMADLMVQGLETLPEATQKLLETASCLGVSFSLQLLADIEQMSVLKAKKTLQPSVTQGSVLPSYNEVNPANAIFHFAHNEIRETIYTGITHKKLLAIRLNAGLILAEKLTPTQYRSRVYEIAGHLNNGSPLLNSRQDKESAARVNLDAGRKAREASNFGLSWSYFKAGLACLDEESWRENHGLCTQLHIEGSEAALLNGRFEEVERLFHITCSQPTDINEKCRVYRVRIKALKARSKPEKAVATGLEALSMLGISITNNPGRVHIFGSLMLTELKLRRHGLTRLLELPQLDDNRAQLIMGFLHDISHIAYSSNPGLLPIISGHAIRLSLKYGNSPDSSVVGYLTHGFLLCSLFSRYTRRGCLLGTLGLDIHNRHNTGASNHQGALVYNTFIRHWHRHTGETLPELREAALGCFNNGDLDSAANAACSLVFRQYILGINLDKTREELDEQLQMVERTGQQLPLTLLRIVRQAISCLSGSGESPTHLKGSHYDEDIQLPEHLNSGDYSSYCVVCILKLIHAVIFQKNELALHWADQARPHLASLSSSVFIPVYYFYDSLAQLAGFNKQSKPGKVKSSLRVQSNQLKMQWWAQSCPQNYEHKFNLVEAERKRVQGKVEKAMELYDLAIKQAKEQDYLQEEALGYELAARMYRSRGKAHISRIYIREARYCYYRWGAKAKVQQLNRQDITGLADPEYTESTQNNTPLLPREGGSRLDMMTVIKASRIFSSERILDELLKKMMRIMMESAGAQRGFLIFQEGGEWVIRVRGSIYRDSMVTLSRTPLTDQEIASSAVINYVIHTESDVILNDACKEGPFTNDIYILQKKPRSLLCMPVIHQQEIVCVLYLENNLATGAFPPDRQELIHLLATQAAISLKNSQLFTELESTVSRLNTEEEKRKFTQLQLLHAEKLSALGRLSASIAHEFGNPLMGIKYLIDDFRKREGINESDRQLLDLGLEECNRMRNLTLDLQRFNKPTSGKFTQADPHRLIDNVLLFQKKHFFTNRIRVHKQFDHSVGKIEVIVDQITQVLFNLTMNSVDAMTDNGGLLTITTRLTENAVVIEVTDTGNGIPYENQGRIFEPFFSTKTEEDGTGLGLSISYGIVKHHGGDLTFNSRPYHGTTFTLSLPLSPVEDGGEKLMTDLSAC